MAVWIINATATRTERFSLTTFFFLNREYLAALMTTGCMLECTWELSAYIAFFNPIKQVFFFFFLLILVRDKQMHKGVLVFFSVRAQRTYRMAVLIQLANLYLRARMHIVHVHACTTTLSIAHKQCNTPVGTCRAWAFIQTCFVSLAGTHSTQPSLIHVGATVMIAYGIMHYLHTLPRLHPHQMAPPHHETICVARCSRH